MYNRYVPQPDGSYSRRRIQDQPMPPSSPREEKRPPQAQWQPAPEPPVNCVSQPQFNPGPSAQRQRPGSTCRPRPAPQKNPNSGKQQETGILTFLKQLLPKDFDTGDLLIILLLLLMSGDCQEDQNTAILTLVLYLFL